MFNAFYNDFFDKFRNSDSNDYLKILDECEKNVKFDSSNKKIHALFYKHIFGQQIYFLDLEMGCFIFTNNYFDFDNIYLKKYVYFIPN